jgi:tetratricopeptide (TPR) repeat protein
LTLNNLGDVEIGEGHLDAASSDYERALAIREKLLGPDSPDLEISLDGLAEIDLAIGKCPEARELSGRAEAILRKGGSPWWDLIESLGISAYCEERAPQLAELRAQLEPIVAQALAGPDVDRRGDAQFALGIVLYKQGERARGLAMIKKGAQAYRDGGQPEGAAPMDDWISRHPR